MYGQFCPVLSLDGYSNPRQNVQNIRTDLELTKIQLDKLPAQCSS
jgi:hypothetical protein